jgi:hypothetical protein
LVDWTPAERIQADAYRLSGFIQGGANAEALGVCFRLRANLTEVTDAIAQAAFDSGMTKKRIAAILAIPPSALRDLQSREGRA